MQRSDQMSRDDWRAIQRMLNAQDFGPLVVDGVPGPRTLAAYSAYLDGHVATTTVPLVTPAPAKPWYLTRRAVGGLVGLLGVVAQFYEITLPEHTTELVLRGIELVPELVAYAGFLVAWWGGLRAKAPIDPDLLLPHVRLPRRLRAESVPTDAAEPRGAAVDRPRADPRGHFGDLD